MVLRTLKLSNYKQYKDLELEFREGLVGVIGKNGAGKSTIFEAILYCLFGKDEGNKSHIRSVFADPKANVELELHFWVAESLFRVKREFRGKALAVGAELYKNDVLVAKGVSAVNDEIVKVLHIERDAFKRSVFSGQKELSELSDASGEARKRMVRRMLGLDTLDDIQTRVNADLRDLASQMTGQRQHLLSEQDIQQLQEALEHGARDIAAALSDAEKQVLALKSLQEAQQNSQAQFDREEQRFKQYNSLQNDAGQARERLTVLQQQQTQLEQKLETLRRQQAENDGVRTEWTAFEVSKQQLEALEREHARHINRQARMSKISETGAQLDETQQQLTRLEQQLQHKEEVTRQLSAAQESVARLETAIEARRNELRGIEQKIGGIQSGLQERAQKLAQLRALGREGACPTCLQPLLEGYERAVTELETEIKTLEILQLKDLESQKEGVIGIGKDLKQQQQEARQSAEQLLQQQTRISELLRQKHSAEQLKAQLEARLAADEAILKEIGAVTFDDQTWQALKQSVASREAGYRQFLNQENYIAKELPETTGLLQRIRTQMADASTQIEKTGLAIADLAFDEQAYNTARQELSRLADQYRTQAENLRAVEKSTLELQAAQAKVTEKLLQHERIQASISDKMAEAELLRKLSEMLGLFKTEILEKISPGISREASELFSRITKGKYERIQVDDNFDFSIADGGVYYPIERFSGGEIDLANFCLRIAITKAIMDLSGSDQRIEFLAFDEIFGSQDEERRIEMMMALHYLQEQFRQIYIVSHIESLRDFFPHLLEVQLGAEGSGVVWR